MSLQPRTDLLAPRRPAKQWLETIKTRARAPALVAAVFLAAFSATVVIRIAIWLLILAVQAVV